MTASASPAAPSTPLDATRRFGGIRAVPRTARAVAQNVALRIPAVRTWAYSRHVLSTEEAGGAAAYASHRAHTDVAGKAILELGPGQGLDVLRHALRDGARRCAAVDVVPFVGAEPGIEYRVYDGKRLPFGDGEFDVVWSWAVLEHLRWPEITLREVARVLRPGGLLLGRIDLRDHYQLRPGPWRERVEWLDCLRYPAWLWWLATSRRAAYVNRMRASGWLRLLPASGFEAVHVRRQTSDVLRAAWRDVAWLRRWAEDDIATFGLDVVYRRRAAR